MRAAFGTTRCGTSLGRPTESSIRPPAPPARSWLSCATRRANSCPASCTSRWTRCTRRARAPPPPPFLPQHTPDPAPTPRSSRPCPPAARPAPQVTFRVGKTLQPISHCDSCGITPPSPAEGAVQAARQSADMVARQGARALAPRVAEDSGRNVAQRLSPAGGGGGAVVPGADAAAAAGAAAGAAAAGAGAAGAAAAGMAPEGAARWGGGAQACAEPWMAGQRPMAGQCADPLLQLPPAHRPCGSAFSSVVPAAAAAAVTQSLRAGGAGVCGQPLFPPPCDCEQATHSLRGGVALECIGQAILRSGAEEGARLRGPAASSPPTLALAWRDRSRARLAADRAGHSGRARRRPRVRLQQRRPDAAALRARLDLRCRGRRNGPLPAGAATAFLEAARAEAKARGGRGGGGGSCRGGGGGRRRRGDCD